MSDCIVCKKPLKELEMALNMDFHSGCSPTVIKEAWKLLKDE